MNYEEHAVGGLVSATIVTTGVAYYTRNIVLSVISFVMTLFMSLYPDMDTGSKSRRYITLLGVLSIGYLVYTGSGYLLEAIYISSLLIIPGLFKHRGFTHTLLFGGIISYFIYYISSTFIDASYIYFIIPGVIGELTHLILDKHIRLI